MRISWTPLSCPEVDRETSAKLRKRASALAERVEALLAARASFDADVEQIESTDVSESDPTGIADVMRGRQTDLLREELVLRRELGDLDVAHRRELAALTPAARQKHVDERERIRGALVSIGFIDAPATSRVLGKLTPGMVLGHIDVLRAKQRADSLSAGAASYEFSRQNAEAMRRVVETLESVRSRAVSVACL